jgi:hypothetical protein
MSLRLNSYSQKKIAIDVEARVNGETSNGDTDKVNSY